MERVGIIAEYNPFHNGHIYHIKKVKEQFQGAEIVLVLSSAFTQRGTPNILNKWERTSLALTYGVDLVIELPFPFSVQSADFFAQGAIEILKAVKATKLVFGSESKNTEKLQKIAEAQLYNKTFQKKVKSHLEAGINYPSALNAALKEICKDEVITPNDLLGVSYIKEILRQDAKIEAVAIQRTNNYHDENLQEEISSATSIRLLLKNKEDISKSVPKETLKYLMKEHHLEDDYFLFLKYQIYQAQDLSIYLDVDEGIENRILKEIDTASSWEELTRKIKTKRYTYNKINRMFTHILCGFTKEQRKEFKHITYLRILGFSKTGQQILKSIKKDCPYPIYTTFQKNCPGLQLEKKVTAIYASVLNEKEKQKLIQKEYQKSPIRKEHENV